MIDQVLAPTLTLSEDFCDVTGPPARAGIFDNPGWFHGEQLSSTRGTILVPLSEVEKNQI